MYKLLARVGMLALAQAGKMRLIHFVPLDPTVRQDGHAIRLEHGPPRCNSCSFALANSARWYSCAWLALMGLEIVSIAAPYSKNKPWLFWGHGVRHSRTGVRRNFRAWFSTRRALDELLRAVWELNVARAELDDQIAVLHVTLQPG